MVAMHVRPALLPTAGVLRAAIERSGMTLEEIGRKVGKSGPSIRNYRDGRTAVEPAMAAKLGKLLNVDPTTLVGGGKKRGRPAGGKKRGRPPGSKNGAGPAARAVALLAAPRPAEVRSVPVPAPPAVFRMELRADGSMTIDVRAILGARRGAELVRHLLDFGLLPDGEP